jgi:hypothetical protein
VIHAAGGESFEVSDFVRRLEEEAGDVVGAGDGFDEAVVGLGVELEAGVFHEICFQ